MEDRNIRGGPRGRHLQHRRAPLPLVDGRAAVAAQIPVGLFMVRYGAATNFAEPTGKLYDVHKLIGLTILLLALVRLVYRAGARGSRRRADAGALGEAGEPHHALGDLRAADRRAAARLARDVLLRAVRAVRHQAAGADRAEDEPRRRACSSCTWWPPTP